MGGARTVGIVGLGVISGQYLQTLADTDRIEVRAVADLDMARAEAVAETIPGCRAVMTAELLRDADIDIVLNLTIPAAHAGIALQAIAAGKEVFLEKPLASTLDEARAVMAAAEAAGIRVGCAPDTVLGTGVQTARAAIESGAIGQPVSASATWVSAGHERWHPQPDFYYRDGGGPLLDMGPYYITSLVHLLGPVVAVSGASSRSRSQRLIGSGPRAGERIDVEVDTHLVGILHHAGGALSTVTMSFDGVATTAAPIEVHGVAGSLLVPDPNTFDGEVRVHPSGGEWTPVPAAAGYVGAGRGVGLIDFAAGQGRASGALALHVLEVMTALARSAQSGARESIDSAPEVPTAVPLTHPEGWRRPTIEA